MMQPNVAPLRPSLYEQLHRDADILTLIDKADEVCAAMGYTDHGRRHATLVATNASRILAALGYGAHECDLAAVAGLMHDLGNCAGRHSHAGAGAVFVYQLLIARGVGSLDAATVMAAVGNHDESEQGTAVDVTSAALIIADKADIHRSRVRTRRPEDFDVHDRINWAVSKAEIDVALQAKAIELRLTADPTFATAADILDLFSVRFAMSASAAKLLQCAYSVVVNGEVIL
ncbi:MAG: phosphohydrolase [Candidatus Eremiobacter antarcticus]|nr:HD domain-containing protein [Candidatus Eremiobacteraeota bacterium]MBC5807764.1 HD domain-containing protein [Candidatus Eremiobacteraeota bacterium]PZR60617.1 MAG: phosphohydrolase [Candidatus Eremiobacter sp. RRmetagenome_bin22]